jgi:hypothetical protein
VTAFADTVPADGDAVTVGNQAFVVLPDASPGQVVTWPITFRLTCTGTNHVGPGATIQLDLLSATVPLDGHASATSTAIGPVPDTWPAGGQPCPSPAPTVPSDGPSTVTLTMPTTPGDSYLFSLMWSRFGATGLSGSSAITFQVDVVGNTAPTLHLPAGQSVEATSPAGAAVSWSASATDTEDAIPPTPTCTPASGSTFPLGDTTVQCTVTDGGGLSDSGSFLIHVGDTTAPSLVGMPTYRAITTGDPAGATLTYTAPTATDAADPSPAVGCLPASGSHLPLGTTTVTCTATDASGNAATASFDVAVSYVPPVPPVAWSAIWGEPVATNGTFAANPGRTVPVKVEILADGARRTSGSAVLTLASCGGAPVSSLPMSWGGGRWNASLDTSSLGGPGCYTATAALDGNVAGTIRIDLKGVETAAGGGPKGHAKK